MTQDAAEPAETRVHELRGWRKLLLWLSAWLIRCWTGTLRFNVTSGDAGPLKYSERPLIIVLWHNRIFVTGEMRRRFRHNRPTYGMVSASQDGAWLAALFERLGVRSARGSSSRRSLSAAREMIKVLREGDDVAITPDGPRGPLYTFHPGATLLATTSAAPLLLLSPNFRRAWRVNSWDGLYLPVPFSTIDLQVRLVQPEELPRDRSACTEYLRSALQALTVDTPHPPRALRSQESTVKGS